MCYGFLLTAWFIFSAEDLDWGPAADVKSTRVMNTILDAELPNLVVLNGDLITGENKIGRAHV